MPPAIEGSDGSTTAFNVARRLFDFCLSDAEAWELLCEYNERCQPPWSEKELRHKLASASKARVRVDMEARS
jgi:hypothetical protein